VGKARELLPSIDRHFDQFIQIIHSELEKYFHSSQRNRSVHTYHGRDTHGKIGGTRK